MITFNDAYALVVAAGLPLGSERVPIARAHGRVLAAPVVAAVDSPPADVSAMDGYAVRDGDPVRLKVVGTSFPGAGFAGEVGPGACVRLFTGAPIPAGLDRVVVQEIVSRKGDWIVITGALSSGRHIRRRGSDFRRGDELLPAGLRLNARGLVAAAGADLAELDVWRQPRVIVIGSGDELVPPGQARHTPGSIPESVSVGVAAMIEDWGGQVVDRRHVADDPAEFTRVAEQALQTADLLVVTGGASVGERDFAKPVFAGLGLDLVFSKVAIKPGKPVWFGRVGDKWVLGLPGNPTSALVTARLLLAPLIVGLAGQDPGRAARWCSACLEEAMAPCGDRETFVRGRRLGERVVPLPNQDSAAQRSLAQADVLIRRRSGAAAAQAGDEVAIIDF